MAATLISSKTVWLVVVFLAITFHTTSTLQCYQFTWAGENNNTDCDEHKYDENDNPIPCILPVVYTVPRNLPPDIEDLNDHCSKYPCPPYWCNSDTQICLRWSWFDVTGKVYNYTNFCGTVADMTSYEKSGAVPVTSGCWDETIGTFTKEVCACDNEDRCNDSTTIAASLKLVSLATLFILILRKFDLIS